ncbi:DMT family transporter [Desulfoscipio geothermicus]|uniref:Threonine/homoserine efflux transporter RhtA n=1 Tax=Desulfoscipio geothermicus DSM 3669 TaxID=1121426 RepID=A0A1I6DZY6_9FIRM|nr:EamA family transporter [Desulfoscipio geothermicus]SFR10995.1 Threonine/homoserine efflux transporter RhtA [Desulfoscipio geothermicus DSM 3669]
MTQTITTEKKGKESTGILLVLVATISLSTEAIAAKIAYREGAGVMTTLFLRYAVAAFFFWAEMIISKRPWKLSRSRITSVAALALGGQSVTVLCLFYAFKYIPAAMAILFLYVYPTIVTLLSYFLLKEPLTWRKMTALFMTLAGCTVILGQPVHGLDPRGVILALGAAVMNAIFLVGSTRLLADIPVPVYNAYMTGIVALFFLGLGSIKGALNFSLNLQAWEAVLFLGLICTVLSLAALFRGVEIIGASRAAIISTFEPVSTALLGFWLLQETLTGWQLLGGALVVTGVMLQSRE